jgi:predicted MFS family arabinose efflux permease
MSAPRLPSSPTGYAWVVLFVVFLVSAAAPLNQFKVPPMMPLLMESFQLDLSMAGLLMSIFAATGFILALPAGFILQRLGPKAAGLIAAGCTVIGAVIGALSSSTGLLLASRVIEGIGMGLIAVVAPAIVGMWFPVERRGTPMGIWATWMPVGRIIMYNVAPALGTAIGWQAVWWFGAAFALIAFVLYWALFRVPPAWTGTMPSAQTGERLPPVEGLCLGRAMANRHIWLLTLTFCCYGTAFLAFSTFLPTFLVSVRGYSLGLAGFVASLTGMTIGSCPLGGWISDRIGSRKLVYTVALLLLAAMWLLPFKVTGWLIPAFVVVLGIVAGPIPTAIFAAVPEVMGRPQLVGIGMAVVALGQNLGMFIGPVLFGKLVEMTGWASAGYMLIPICLLGVFAGRLVKVR